MNELMIMFEGGQWLYFKTRENDAETAYTLDFLYRTLAVHGINYDNMKFVKAVLRNEEGETISEYTE